MSRRWRPRLGRYAPAELVNCLLYSTIQTPGSTGGGRFTVPTGMGVGDRHELGRVVG